jgi:cytochrome c oxidase cbb3-type subunit 4
METYTAMRTFADSWGLLYMVLIFLGILVFAFRPGSKKIYEEQARIPLNEEQLNND